MATKIIKHNYPVAIIGLHGRFPQADTLENFWKNLSEKKICTTTIPPDRWDHHLYADTDADGKIQETWGGFISDVDAFDPLFFRITPKDAREMDPQQRLFLESAWSTLENAGYGAHRENSKNTIGLFVGSMWHEYSLHNYEQGFLAKKYSGPGSLHWALANRVSFCLNLKGPSLAIDSACSSSLLAVHLACQSLYANECEMALAGGINLNIHPGKYIYLAHEGLLALDQNKACFQPGSEGYIPGEGVASLLLKPLHMAIKDGDYIHAIIKGTATNHNGGGMFFKVPDAASQANLLTSMFNEYDIDPETINHIEMSAFGSEMVDTTEFFGISRAFNNFTDKKKYCTLGSLKPYIGHLEAASGISQIIKVLLQLRHRKIVPSKFTEQVPNELNIEESPFVLQRELKPWEPVNKGRKNIVSPRRCGINSFGAGGTNVFVVLEEYIPQRKIKAKASVSVKLQIIVLSANTADSLKLYMKNMYNFINNQIDKKSLTLTDIAHTLQTGREALKERIAIVADSIDILLEIITKYLTGVKDIAGFITGQAIDANNKAIPDNETVSMSPEMLAAAWVRGKKINWNLLYADIIPRKVPLPTYPFARERYWLTQKPATGNFYKPLSEPAKNTRSSDGAQLQLINYFKALLSQEILLPVEKIDEHEPFHKLGLDSLVIKRINAHMETDLGPLSKTLFFEHSTIADLATALLAGNNAIREHFSVKTYYAVDIDSQVENVIHNDFSPLYERTSFIEESEGASEIAIIGISGRYPMADSLDSFWDNLVANRDCVTEIPKDRWDYKQWYDPDINTRTKSYSKWGGFLADVDAFDPLFFEISPREAELMDPQERLFLQICWETIEDAGYTCDELNRSKENTKGTVGVFAGVMWGEYHLYGLEETLKGNWVTPSSMYWSIPNRVSFCFNFTGPSIAVDTACSSSLTAIHLACASISKGECDAAIAGGVSLSLHPAKYLYLSQKRFASTDGRCRSFGEGGDGYVPGEGVGAILLKPLKAARNDKDHIYAVIKSSQINHGGRTNGFTVPNPKAQAEVITAVLRKANINPRTIGYIEAHGTGTALGDPIELEGLIQAFNNFTNDKHFCSVGSVKSNIGHLEAAAGIAGLTKIILQMKNKELVASIHCAKVNTNLDFNNTPFLLQTSNTPWEPVTLNEGGIEKKYPIRAGISSFGAGGAGAHLILEEYNHINNQYAENCLGLKQPELIVISAKNSNGLRQYVERFINFLKKDKITTLRDMAYTLQIGREHMEERLALVVSAKHELIEKLTQFIQDDSYAIGVYCKNIHASKITLRHIINGNDGENLVKSIIEQRELDKLAQLWIADTEINWKLLYKTNIPMRISLPTYPFSKDKYWIPTLTQKNWSSLPRYVFTQRIQKQQVNNTRIIGRTERNHNVISAGNMMAQYINVKRTKQNGVPIEKTVQNTIQQIIAGIIKTDYNNIDLDMTFGNYGFDSIMMKELSEIISSQYKINITPAQLFSLSNVRTLSINLISNFSEEIKNYHISSNLADYAIMQSQFPEDDIIHMDASSIITDEFVEIDHQDCGPYWEAEQIAIVGASCIFPGSRGLDEFWNNLEAGKDLISEIPMERWDWREYFDEDNSKLDKSNSKWGGFIADVDAFDPLFFEISPREAELMDPQHRLFLEVVWNAIEDSGHRASDFSGRPVGIFAGVQFSDYEKLLIGIGETSAQMGSGNEHALLANRVSYIFNFRGPSEAINTACSSSLVAVHRAVQSIQIGESELAIAGGISLLLSPFNLVNIGNFGVLSPDGRCKTFDKNANGYVKGEGVGALLLRPLREAKREKNHIYAIIRASGENHGGKANSLTAPNAESQSELITSIYFNEDIDPETITYIEAHGTGTELGDPIEIDALKKSFNDLLKRKGKSNNKEKYCGLGSVKTHIGHLEAAAGIAGIIKILLAIKHEKLTKILHFNELNPYINLEESPFYIIDETRAWQRLQNQHGDAVPLRAGVSSFGVGGTNAHVVLEEYIYPSANVNNKPKIEPLLFVLSAKNEERLIEYSFRVLEFLKNEALFSEDANVSSKKCLLQDVLYTLQVGREPMDERLAMIVTCRRELLDKLEKYYAGNKNIDKMYSGNVKESKAKFGHFKSFVEEDGKEYIRNMLAANRIEGIAELWIAGIEIEWKLLYANEIPNRISMPTYPFERKRYWFNDEKKIIKNLAKNIDHTEKLHPLLTRNTSTFKEQQFTVEFTGNEFYLTDHVVGDMKILPGVTYIEMARAAAELSANEKVIQLKNIVWIRPVIVAEERVQLHISLYPHNNLVDYKIFSQKDIEIIHAQGKIFFNRNADKSIEDRYIDIDDVKNKCKLRMSGSECYERFRETELYYGKSFQTIQQVWSSESEALAELELNRELCEHKNEFGLHPSIMDGALQSVIGIVGASVTNGNGPYLPFSLGEIHIVTDLPENCYAYVQLKISKQETNTDIKNYDIQLLDRSGRVLVSLKDYSIRALNKDVHLQYRENSNVKEVFYYTHNWKKLDLDEQVLAGKTESIGCTLLFCEDDEIIKAFQEKHNYKPLIVIQTGDFFEDCGNGKYTINPKAEPHYIRLMEQLIKNEWSPGNVIHMWSNADYATAKKSIEEKLHQSIYSLFYLSKTLMNFKMKKNVNLLYVYFQEKDNPDPFYAAISGFIKTLILENRNFECKTIGVETRKTSNAAWLTEILAKEMKFDFKTGSDIRYENEVRHVKEISEYSFSKRAMDSLGVVIRNKGVYVITGGVGGLGLIFAEYLARNYKAKLVLTGRSELTTEKKQKLSEFENCGSEVMYVRSDVSKPDEVIGLIEAVKQRFSEINGIIHSAGINRDSFIMKKTMHEVEQVLAPKIFGTVYIDDATKNEKLDFFVMFSSTAAVMGNTGQGDYAYANCFIDNYAKRREILRSRNERHGKTLCISWPLWKDGGMKIDDQTQKLLARTIGMSPLDNTNGIAAFINGLSADRHHLLVMKGERKKINQALGVKVAEIDKAIQSEEMSQLSIQADSMDDNLLLEKIKQSLLTISVSILKLAEDEISLDEDLNEYGFDSITLTEFSNRLNETYNTQITPAIFFELEYPSIDLLARHLLNKSRDIFFTYYGKSSGTSLSNDEQATCSNNGIFPIQEKILSRFENFISKDKAPNQIIYHTNNNEPIAIIGMSGIFPQSDDLEEFWEHLEKEDDLITEIPAERWDWKAYYGDPNSNDNKTYAKWGGFVKDVDKFDALFFGISPLEAELMDPQQRMFLEVTWKTLEDAGYRHSKLGDSKTGLFVGVSGKDYNDLHIYNNVKLDAYAATGNTLSIVANRISYLLNLRGPSEAIDTACSSSLVAIHRGIAAIRNAECDMVIAGGTNALLHPRVFIFFSKAGMLSKDGRCMTFDSRANGYVRGEGAGAILLKPLKKAEEDRDHIYGIIRGSAENHGGRANSLTAPNANAQAELLIEAYKRAGISPDTISYIEAHGTGTSLGDPIEVNGLKMAFENLYSEFDLGEIKEAYCGIGSVKTNIGHLETSAGIAGIIKVLLSMKHKKLPGNIHLKKINPFIKLDGSPFYFLEKTKNWARLLDKRGNEIPRRAGVSSFGFGGSNAHIILEEYEILNEQRENHCDDITYLFILSAKNKERLQMYAEKILKYIKEKVSVQQKTQDSTGRVLEMIKFEMIHTAARLLNVEPDDIELNEKFESYGFDPVSYGRFIGKIGEKYNIEMNQPVYIEYDSLGLLMDYMYINNKERLHEYYIENVIDEKREDLFDKTHASILLPDIVYTLQTGREEMEERLAFTVNTTGELCTLLDAFCNGIKKDDIYTGNVKQTRDDIGFYKSFTEVEKAEYIIKLVKNRELQQIARLWLLGAKIDWRLLSNNTPNKISLPTYPFARERYWITENENTTPGGMRADVVNVIHPLLQQNTSDLSEQRYISTFTGGEFFLRDHVVKGARMLPGVAYLEMARAAVEKAAGVDADTETMLKLKNVVWARPIAVNGAAVAVQIGLYPEDDGSVGYEIYTDSEDEGGEAVVHSQGYALLNDVRGIQRVDIAALQSESTQQRISSSQCYAAYKMMGIEYGPSLQGIEELYASPNHVLAKLRLPESVLDTQDDYILHPSMLDSALQASIGLAFALGENGNANPLLPFALDELAVYDKCSRDMWAVVRYSKENISDKVQKLDIDLCNAEGEVCVHLNGFTSRVLEDEIGTTTIETVLLEPYWKETSVVEDGHNGAYATHVVILCELERINREDVETRMQNARCIVMQSEEKGIEQRYASYAVQVFEEIKRIIEEKPKAAVLIQVVTLKHGDKQLFSGLSGLLKTAEMENPKVIGQLIMVESTEFIVEKLKENSHKVHDKEIHYQANKRLVKRLSEVVTQGEAGLAWKDGGVYLVTGGAGGLGLIFAQDIVAKVKDATVILTGRSELNEEKLAELKKLGLRVTYKSIDVNDKQEVATMLEGIVKEHGTINGIIHGAGIIRDNFIIKKTGEEFAEVLKPKVSGLVNIDEASKELVLDFIILFSSATGAFGNIGQADYAAANAFMDAYAGYRNELTAQGKRHGKMLSLNWTLWQEGGMHMDAGIEKILSASGMVPLRTESGIHALYAGFASGKGQVIVLEGYRVKLEKIFFKQELDKANFEAQSINEGIKSEIHVSENELQEKLINYFKKLLSSIIKLPMNRIEADKAMEHYGIDSILAMRMTNQLEKTFGSLSKTLFFEYQNIKELAGYFLETQRDKLIGLLGLDERYEISQDETGKVNVKNESVVAKQIKRRRGMFLVPNRDEFRKGQVLDIAIVGLSGRYPGARNIEEFWMNLRNGKDSITEIPRERWDHNIYFDEDKNKFGKSYSKWGGFIDGVDEFDPLFFNISPYEAGIMDPQERIFLECIYNVIEDAGYTSESLGGKKDKGLGRDIGVFVGVMYEEYQLYGVQAQVHGFPIALRGNPSSIANRISYFFNFHGPSIALDTMCSSSLTAIYLASQSIQRGDCNVALAGGVNISVHPNKYLLLSQGKFVSSTGRCESFGVGRDGYVPGEGVGAVMLKDLKQAERDGDHIYGIIKGVAINHGGKTNGYTVPNPNAQAELIREAIKSSGVDARTISYIEAHGTGTVLGDPIEIAGLTKAFEYHIGERQYCAIGSVKSNIGHCESAAGIAGVTKVLLQMKYGQIAPSLHSRELNPNIDFTKTPFVVQQELAVWKRPVIDGVEMPRRAGVSSFGAGGANAHVVLEEYIPRGEVRPSVKINMTNPAIIVLSAKNEERLKEYCLNLLQYIKQPEIEEESLQNMEALQTYSTELKQMSSKLLSVSDEDIDADVSLTELGFDAVKLSLFKDRIEERYEIKLDSAIFTKAASLSAITGSTWQKLHAREKSALMVLKNARGQSIDISLADMAYTLQVGREPMEVRLAIIVSTLAELQDKLKRYYLEGREDVEDIYRGHVKKNKDVLAVFAADEDMAKTIDAWISKRKYSKLLDLWTKGLDVDWIRLYGENKPRRISLPIYPFAREHYWVPAEDTTVINRRNVGFGNTLHPLLQQNTSDVYGLRYSNRFTGEEFFLRDHVVEGARMLSGFAYLEMARLAVERALRDFDEEETMLQIRNVVWARPIVVNDKPVEVHIGIYPEGNGAIKYEIYTDSENENTDVVVHSHGRAELSAIIDIPRIDIAAVKSQGSEKILTSNECYAAFKAVGLAYGASFQGIAELYVQEGQVLARLRLPESVIETQNEYTLHPSIMDSALQAGIGLTLALGDSGISKPLLPFALEELDIYDKCSAEMWAVLRYSKGIASEKVQKFDIDVCDEEGKVCVRLRGFASRMFEEEEGTIISPGKAINESLTGKILLTPVWDIVSPDKGELFPLKMDRVVVVGGVEDEKNMLKEQYAGTRFVEIHANESIEEIAKKLEKQGTIHHIFWIAPHRDLKTIIDDVIVNDQSHGVMQCYRMIKALLGLGYGAKNLGMSVVTKQSQPIYVEDKINPTHVSVHGLIGSLAKEYDNWKIRLVDIEVHYEWPFEDILRIKPDPQGNALVYRGGEWYRQKLIPTQKIEMSESKYRRGGVYVVIGGAGGIGEVWSEYMISTYNARIIWIGRRERNAEIDGKIKRFSKYGTAPEYIRADASDRADLERAYKKIKSRYDKIHGVIHAAIVLLDKTLLKMEEAEFKASLSAKVDVSVHLAEVFGREQMDFVLFFSSLQSMSKAPGQSNYAAGCVFKDAFAHELSHEWSCAVKVINWGFWGSVGVVAAEEYRDRMARLGIGSIESGEGMEALEFLLSGPVNQLVFLKTTKSLEIDGMIVNEFFTVHSDEIPSCIQSIQREDGSDKDSKEKIEYIVDAQEQNIINEIYYRVLMSQLRSVGIITTGRIDKREIKKQTGIKELYSRWLDDSFRVLTENGYLGYDSGHYTMTGKAHIDRDAIWREWDEMKSKWEHDENKRAQIRLADVTLRALPKVLTGKILATDIIFPNSSMELVEGTYKNNFISDYFNEVLANTAVAYVQKRITEDALARLRFLEIGAGTGGTSAMMFMKLQAYQENIADYCYTDISKAFLLHGEKEYGTKNSYLSFKIFNIEEPLADQGIEVGSYDIVLATNVLHATRNMRNTLKNAKALLKKNGIIIINEISSNSLYTHLTFGLLEGWWLYDDAQIRITGSPGLYAERWQEVLEREGFRGVFFPVKEAHKLGQQIIVAESDGVVRQLIKAKVTKEERLIFRSKKNRKITNNIKINKSEIAHIPLEKQIMKIVSEIVRINERDLDLDADLKQFGFDSILITRLLNNINSQYGLNLTPAVFVNYSNLQSFIDYLKKTINKAHNDIKEINNNDLEFDNEKNIDDAKIKLDIKINSNDDIQEINKEIYSDTIVDDLQNDKNIIQESDNNKNAIDTIIKNEESKIHGKVIKDEIVYNGIIHISFEYYEYNPDFPTIIFFPGILNRLETWAFLYDNPVFKNNYNLITFEPRGQYKSTKFLSKNDSYTVEENRCYVYEIIKKLNLQNKKFELVGLSSGCSFIVDFALEYADLINSILLFAPVFSHLSPDPHMLLISSHIGEKIGFNELDSFLDLFFFDFWSENNFITKENTVRFYRDLATKLFKEFPEMMMSVCKTNRAFGLYYKNIEAKFNYIKNLQIPQRIIFGDKDLIVSNNFKNELLNSIDCTHESIKGMGHLIFLDDQDYFIQKIYNFITHNKSNQKERRKQSRIALLIPIHITIDIHGEKLEIDGKIQNWHNVPNCGAKIVFRDFSEDITTDKFINRNIILTLEMPGKIIFTGQTVWCIKTTFYTYMGITELKEMQRYPIVYNYLPENIIVKKYSSNSELLNFDNSITKYDSIDVDKTKINYEFYENNKMNPYAIIFLDPFYEYESWQFIRKSKALKSTINYLIFKFSTTGEINDKTNSIQYMENYKFIIHQLIKKLNLSDVKFHLISLNSGSTLLFDYALNYTAMIKSVLFINPDFNNEFPNNQINRAKNIIHAKLKKFDYKIFLNLNLYSSFSSNFYLFKEDVFRAIKKYHTNKMRIYSKSVDNNLQFSNNFSDHYEFIKANLGVFKDLSFVKRIVYSDCRNGYGTGYMKDISHCIDADYYTIKDIGKYIFIENEEFCNRLILDFIEYADNKDSINFERRIQPRMQINVPATFKHSKNDNQTIAGTIINCQKNEISGFLFEVNNRMYTDTDFSRYLNNSYNFIIDGPWRSEFRGKIIWHTAINNRNYLGILIVKRNRLSKFRPKKN